MPTPELPRSQPPSSVEALLRPIHRPATYVRRSGLAASYPIRGIWYFLRNKEFHPLFFSRLLPLSIISALVYLILFTFAFLPQVAFLAIWQGWAAWFNAAVLVLGEGLIIIQVRVWIRTCRNGLLIVLARASLRVSSLTSAEWMSLMYANVPLTLLFAVTQWRLGHSYQTGSHWPRLSTSHPLPGRP